MDAGVFNQYRKRLLTSGAAAQFLAAVISQPRVQRLLSIDHFSIDTALIEAWTRPNSSELRDDRAEPPQLESGAEGDLYGENGERMPYYPARPGNKVLTSGAPSKFRYLNAPKRSNRRS